MPRNDEKGMSLRAKRGNPGGVPSMTEKEVDIINDNKGSEISVIKYEGTVPPRTKECDESYFTEGKFGR